jgi:hypothetical protein
MENYEGKMEQRRAATQTGIRSPGLSVVVSCSAKPKSVQTKYVSELTCPSPMNSTLRPR